MPQLRIAIIIGTRPEAIKLAPVIHELEKHRDCRAIVLLTGQHREMVEQVMQHFGLTPDQDLAIMQRDQSLTDIASRSIDGLSQSLESAKPDLVVVQGDTTTAFAGALTAFYMHIPVAHVEAGLRTNTAQDPFPEEMNRRLISQLATLNFAPTDEAVVNLKSSGIEGRIIKTGNTVVDALLKTAATRPECPVEGLDWDVGRVILATVHRRENWGARIDSILRAFSILLDRYPDLRIVLPLHRNLRVRQPIEKALGQHPRAFLVEPLSYPGLIGAIQRCHLLLTDSGGLQEEAPSLGKPVLVLRETTERPEAIRAGTAKLAGTDTGQIVEMTASLLDDDDAYQSMARVNNPFGDGRAAERIVSHIRQFFDANVDEPNPAINKLQ